MAADERYFIGPGLRSKLREVITRVDGLPAGSGGGGDIPTRLQTMQQPGGSGGVFRICTYTGAWAIDGLKTVTFKNQTTTPNTASAINLFLSLPDNGQRNCAIAKDGTAWHLIQWQWDASTALSSATLGSESLEFARINVASLGTASTVSISVTTCSTATAS
jgi:hypothetical protein